VFGGRRCRSSSSSGDRRSRQRIVRSRTVSYGSAPSSGPRWSSGARMVWRRWAQILRMVPWMEDRGSPHSLDMPLRHLWPAAQVWFWQAACKLGAVVALAIICALDDAKGRFGRYRCTARWSLIETYPAPISTGVRGRAPLLRHLRRSRRLRASPILSARPQPRTRQARSIRAARTRAGPQFGRTPL
jgi:hypothetical protein